MLHGLMASPDLIAVEGTPLLLQLVEAFRKTPAGQTWVKDVTSV